MAPRIPRGLRMQTRYELAPGLEIVPVSDHRFQLRSEFVALELTGETAEALVQHVLMGLRQPATLDEIKARMPGYEAAGVTAQIEELLGAGVLVDADRAHGTAAALFDEIGLGAETTTERLARSRIAIFGLEAHGAHLAQILAQAGVGELVLVDPFPFEEPHLALTPVTDRTAVGVSREAAVARVLAPFSAKVIESGESALSQARVETLVEGSTVVVGCFDQGFAACHHWINRAAVGLGIPALFSDIRATSTFAGPFVFPGRSACWMCYRMRALACEADFDLAMSFEEHLDRARLPRLSARPVLPALPLQLAVALGLEVIKHLTKLPGPSLVGKVMEFDALSAALHDHSLIAQPDCPVCQKKKWRQHPGLPELLGDTCPEGRLEDVQNLLVDARVGIVTDISAVRKDLSEPAKPYVWRSRISNHRFIAERDDTRSIVSGKGMSVQAAKISCLGEALERYSGASWHEDELTFACRADLPGESLDPRELVLYRQEQYAELPYSPYRNESRLAWVSARSLISGEAVSVPASAAFMDYPVHGPDEFLFPITSNGLAAAPSLREAVLRAMYEVIERDAFLITWMNRLDARPHDPMKHPDPVVRELAAAWARRGVRLVLLGLRVDHPVSVFMGVAFQDSGFGGPSATVGLGADIDPSTAARKAALEVGQVRPALRRRARTTEAERVDELAANPALVTSLEDHALLYAHPATVNEFDFLFGDEEGDWPIRSDEAPSAVLRKLINHFTDKQQDVLYVNLTPPDLEPYGLHTVRAILPRFQPIWFGQGEARLGGSRLYELPWKLGLTDAPTEPDALNPMPHPLA